MQKFVSIKYLKLKKTFQTLFNLSMKENDSNTLQGHMYTYRFHMCMALSRDSTYSKHSIAENFVINVNKHTSNKSINNWR